MIRFPDDFKVKKWGSDVRADFVARINNIIYKMEKRKTHKGFRKNDYCVDDDIVVIRSDGDYFVGSVNWSYEKEVKEYS